MYEGFAAMLRQLMGAREISGAELGRRLDGIDKSQVSRWRSGRDRPEPATVVKIADLFGVDRLGMLKLAQWLPGEPEHIDSEEVEALALFRQLSSDRRLAAKDMLRGLAVQPVQTGALSRRGMGPSTPRSRRHGLETHAATSDDSADQGGLSTVSHALKAILAYALSPFGRPIERTVFWPAAQAATVA